jgi:signal recognition particle GTPase
MSYNYIDKDILLDNKNETVNKTISKRKIKNISEVTHSVKKIGNHLAEAANAGIDVVKESTTEILEDILDDEQDEKFTIVIAGNNDVGKTTLLYSAKFGKKFNSKLIVPTVGYNGEYIEIQRNK